MIVRFVEDLYKTCLGREAKPVEIEQWAGGIRNGSITGAVAAYGFFFSPEYKNGNKTDAEYVADLYRAIMGREADEGGLDAWVALLEKGTSREKVFSGFIRSEEFKSKCEKYGIMVGTYRSHRIADVNPDVTAFVARLYTVALNRRFDVAGLESWVSQLLDKKLTPEQVAKGFFGSQEFVNRGLSNSEFVAVAYRTLLDREPDASGYEAWVKALDEGASRKKVLDGFAHSEEFAALCASYGL